MSSEFASRWRQPRVLLAAALAVVAGVLPPVLYSLTFGRGAVAPPRAKAILADAARPAALVDVRTPADFARRHVGGAVSWPLARIESLRSAGEIPAELRDKRLVLICNSGRTTVPALAKLRSLGLADAVHVRGGLADWIADAPNKTGRPWDRFVVAGQVADPPARDASAFHQWAQFTAGFIIKPLYGLISFVLILVLWRARAADLAALRWAMICFFLGEQACALNYLLFGEQSYMMEYLHSYGMALCFGLATYAIFEAMDRRLIRFSEPDQRCAALSLCGRCYKHLPVPCGLKRTFLLIIPAMMALAFMPLTARAQITSYNVSILGMFYNYSHPVAYQMYETLYCPVAALVLMAASMGVLLLKKREPVAWSKVLFAAGMGLLGFGLLRLFIFVPYTDNLLWFVFWEEATELIFIAGVAYVLWTFRRGLFGRGVKQERIEEG